MQMKGERKTNQNDNKLNINNLFTKHRTPYNLRDNVWLELVSQNPKPYMIPSLIILVLFGIVYLAS